MGILVGRNRWFHNSMFLVINYLHAWRPNVDVRERESSVLIHVHTVPLMCIKYVYIIYIYIYCRAVWSDTEKHWWLLAFSLLAWLGQTLPFHQSVWRLGWLCHCLCKEVTGHRLHRLDRILGGQILTRSEVCPLPIQSADDWGSGWQGRSTAGNGWKITISFW